MLSELRHVLLLALALAALLVACDPSGGAQDGAADTGAPAQDTAQPDDDAPDDASDVEGDEDATGVPGDVARLTISHDFGELVLGPYEERLPCISWTLDNDAPLYVERVVLSNEGGFHHSNWYIVPEEHFDGPDGYWRCSTRDFSEFDAIAVGASVLFAQSTQSLHEEQRLGEGVVVKIPPRHRLIAGGHTLNLSGREVTTRAVMSLELLHPRLIKDIAAPFRFSYNDLNIHPSAETRFAADCHFGQFFPSRTMEMSIYWLLPHYHYMGNHFTVDLVGGPRDGERIYELTGFNAEPNGLTFNPPLDVTGATGMRFECGFNNPSDAFVGFGIGDNEMCMMLGFASSPYLFDGSVYVREQLPDDGATFQYGGDCVEIQLLKGDTFAPPSQDELDAPIHIPANAEVDDGQLTTPICQDVSVDRAEAAAERPASLTSIADTIFTPSCAYSSCHGGARPALGLDLTAADLHAELMGHAVQSNTLLPLVAPGDPDGSWLYQIVSSCEPPTTSGAPTPHMPLNAPTLLDPALVGKLRQWIADGAPDN